MKQLQFISHHTARYDHLQGIELALQGGCRWIQLRMKNTPAVTVEETACQALTLCRSYGAVLIINDRPEICLASGAAGVHLGKNDMTVDEARTMLGPRAIIGSTANTFEDLERLAAQGADYIGLGPFRFTATKEGLSPVLGLEGYRKIGQQCRQCDITLPVVAIGGITPGDIPALIETGINGVAISSGILNAPDPAAQTRRFLGLLG